MYYYYYYYSVYNTPQAHPQPKNPFHTLLTPTPHLYESLGLLPRLVFIFVFRCSPILPRCPSILSRCSFMLPRCQPQYYYPVPFCKVIFLSLLSKACADQNENHS